MFGADRDLSKILKKGMLGSIGNYSEYPDVKRKMQVKWN